MAFEKDQRQPATCESEFPSCEVLTEIQFIQKLTKDEVTCKNHFLDGTCAKMVQTILLESLKTLNLSIKEEFNEVFPPNYFRHYVLNVFRP